MAWYGALIPEKGKERAELVLEELSEGAPVLDGGRDRRRVLSLLRTFKQ